MDRWEQPRFLCWKPRDSLGFLALEDASVACCAFHAVPVLHCRTFCKVCSPAAWCWSLAALCCECQCAGLWQLSLGDTARRHTEVSAESKCQTSSQSRRFVKRFSSSLHVHWPELCSTGARRPNCMIMIRQSSMSELQYSYAVRQLYAPRFRSLGAESC